MKLLIQDRLRDSQWASLARVPSQFARDLPVPAGYIYPRAPLCDVLDACLMSQVVTGLDVNDRQMVQLLDFLREISR